MPRDKKGHGSNKRISPRMKEAIRLLQSGEARTVTEAADKAGMNREHVHRQLKRPHVEEYIHSLVKHRNKTVSLLKASNMVDVLLDSAESEAVRADMVKHVRASNGIGSGGDGSQAGGTVVLKIFPAQEAYDPVSGGRVLEASPPPKDITPKTAQLIENIEE